MTTRVLVEGVSDVAALETLAARLGVDLARAPVVPMGGATNVGRFARELAGDRLIGLCDIAEERFFAAALETYFVCNRDLEDEFIRALGADAVIRVIAEQGDLRSLRAFQGQPAQRDRAEPERLRRFFGTTGGRKQRYGTVLAQAVELERVPSPLLQLFDSLG